MHFSFSSASNFPDKISVYSTLVGLLNVKDYKCGEDVCVFQGLLFYLRWSAMLSVGHTPWSPFLGAQVLLSPLSKALSAWSNIALGHKP